LATRFCMEVSWVRSASQCF